MIPLAAAALLLTSCSPAPPQRAAPTYPAAISGTSRTLVVKGQYEPVLLQAVERISLDGSTLRLHGQPATVIVDLPAAADASQPNRGWALVTEASTDDGRELTFIHNESLDEFTIALPASPAPIRYGSVAGREGADVVLFAWGEGTRSFWGYVTVARQATGGDAP